MRSVLCAALLAISFVGCRHAPKEEMPAAKNERKFKVTPDVAAENKAKAAANSGGPAKTTKPDMRPINGIRGRIASVNAKSRFVVVDFAASQLPEMDQRLGVYRVGQKVGEIKVSGPFRGPNIAADIVAGEALFGDEVRSE